MALGRRHAGRERGCPPAAGSWQSRIVALQSPPSAFLGVGELRDPGRLPRSSGEAICWLEMALRRVYVDVIEDAAAVARGAQAHHLARVARLRAGERVEVSDQTTAYRAVTESCTPTEVRFRVEDALPAQPEIARLSVALAIIKFARFEWAIEKLTELGVHAITPLIAARSDAKLVQSRVEAHRALASHCARSRPASSAHRCAERGRRQSRLQMQFRTLAVRRSYLPEPGGPPAAESCSGQATTLLVGPEGGWTQEEALLADRSGFKPVGLGGNILRAETAAVALAAVCAARSHRESER